jgi:glycosyltransferase involved in cell wall biosynthesis
MDPGRVALELRSPVRVGSPVVSVVVPTWNRASMVTDTIAAVGAQDFRDLELIVVDDASTDETARVLQGWVAEATVPMTYLRLERHGGPAVARNAALSIARGRFIAFTDSDCVPSRGWLTRALDGFSAPGIGVVQGLTTCASSSPPFFSHYIETTRLDGSYSTSNIVYRREALEGHRFDPACIYWEDTDLGWRVRGDGWDVAFAPDAVVHHQVIRLDPFRWVLWPTHYVNWPAKAARYPGFRRHLFLGLWVRPMNAAFDLALAGLVASIRWRRTALLAIPYAALFVGSRGLQGRLPAVKVALHAARDLTSFASLVAGSVRYRAVVL